MTIIGLIGSIFDNGLVDRCSIPGRIIIIMIIPKTKKIELDTSLLNIQHYKVHIKGKWSNLGKRFTPSPIPPCSSY